VLVLWDLFEEADPVDEAGAARPELHDKLG
jgi:hypothetical protein